MWSEGMGSIIFWQQIRLLPKNVVCYIAGTKAVIVRGLVSESPLHEKRNVYTNVYRKSCAKG